MPRSLATVSGPQPAACGRRHWKYTGEKVGTQAVPWSAIRRSSASVMKNPCSIESIPASTATAIPSAPLQCANVGSSCSRAQRTISRSESTSNWGLPFTVPDSKSMIPVWMIFRSSEAPASSLTAARISSSLATSRAMKLP